MNICNTSKKNMKNPPHRLALVATMMLVSALGSGLAQAFPEPAGIAATAAAFRYPAALPPESAVRSALARLPELQAARAGIDFSAAERQRLQSGEYEWMLSGETARRRVRGEANSRDWEIAAERPLRWFGKAKKDAELGQHAMTLAAADYANAWREAGRELLAAWFELLREERAALRVAEQVAVGERLLDSIQKRERAGELPKMELLLAQTEHEHLIAEQQQAVQRAMLARAALEHKYPGLPLPPTVSDTPLPEIHDSMEQVDWVERIVAESRELKQAQARTQEKRLLAERIALERQSDPSISLRYTSEQNNETRIVGVGISIPLPGKARSAAHAGALAQFNQAHFEEMGLRNKVEREARRLVAEARAAGNFAATQARIRKQTHLSAALTGKVYLLGESHFTDTLLASRQALETTQSAETAHLDALEHHARLLLDARLIWALGQE